MFYSIQFLRGIAALMVVMTHAALKGQQYGTGSLSWFHIGEGGVDLFFIISGFIMCYTTHNKKISFAVFLRNRVERIIPLYWVLSFVALLIYVLSPGLVNSSGGKTGIIESFLLIPNGTKFLIQNGWTLSYEFYYYFIFSLFILFTPFRHIRYLGISLTLLTLVFMGFIFKPTAPGIVFLTGKLLLEFFFGIASFVIYSNFTLPKPLALLMALGGCFCLVYKNFYGFPDMMLGRVMTSGVPMFFIFLGLINLEEWFSSSKNIFFRFFELLGNSSYSLYLVHPFVLSPVALLLKKLHLLNDALFSLAIVSLSIIAGILTYLFLEKPLASMLKGKVKTPLNTLN